MLKEDRSISQNGLSSFVCNMTPSVSIGLAETGPGLESDYHLN